MDVEFYLIMVGLLVVLAITDLVVGVSNDAVNFLNSAIGSRVASRRTILLVASVGIILGATFSSGMMEVARKGIFNPAMFSFVEVMVIFLAVMFTDILLLDVFNTLALPTSTTVSIVFELLGASVAVAVAKIWITGEGLGLLGQYIQSANALTIVSVIFLSVSIAFVTGALLMWISRWLFSFHYQRKIRWIGGLWSGMALTSLTYFLVFKGLKGASFVTDPTVAWVEGHTPFLLGLSMLFWTVIMQVLLTFFRVNVLRLVVLFGTFALAMAFAGNDLVNFIGVPMAGLESYGIWKASGADAGSLLMDGLIDPVRTSTWLLVSAGAVMILTLWFSAKARSVTETEVNLGRQSDGDERFSSNWLARQIVWYARKAGNKLTRRIPDTWLERTEERFQPIPVPGQGREMVAFDLVRASVNLTAASMLIALATSWKLPLSTTYVSFMVAMGTSLSDRAWGRGSAVFRVAGVLNVIGGWFLTAVIAFSVSGLFALLIGWGQAWTLTGLAVLSVVLIHRTRSAHRRAAEGRRKRNRTGLAELTDVLQMLDETQGRISDLLTRTGDLLDRTLDALLREDRAAIRQLSGSLRQLESANENFQFHMFRRLKHLDERSSLTGRLYLLLFDLEQDILQSMKLIVDSSTEYIECSLPAFSHQQATGIRVFRESLRDWFDRLSDEIRNPDAGRAQELSDRKEALLRLVEDHLDQQVDGIRDHRYGIRNSTQMFRILLESKDLVAASARFTRLFDRFVDGLDDPDTPLVGHRPEQLV